MKTETDFGFIARGTYSGDYHVRMAPYEGLDFSKRCVVFPGQSAAFPGMMKEEVAVSAAALTRFQQADELAARVGLPAVSLYIQAPEKLSSEALALLRNPALFTLQVALFDHLQAEGLVPRAVTGHSFGEYAAVVACGAAKFEDIFKIVVVRDQLSPAPKSTGVMIAVGASESEVRNALRGMEFHLSNVNSPNQVVVSVRPQNEATTHAALRGARLAAKTLTEMTQPYHTPWMEEVSHRLADYIRSENFTFSSPRIPMISMVGAELLTEASPVDYTVAIPERLARQVCEPVSFPQQIKKVLEIGVINFIEAGPAEICAPFIKATLGEGLYKVSPLEKFFSTAGRARAKKSSRIKSEKNVLLGSLSKVISAVTGYSIDEISVEQNFQEDLGIDSIRKAEIVFKFMESMKTDANADGLLQVNLSKLKRIEDVIEHFEMAGADKSGQAQPVTKSSADFKRYEKLWIERGLTDFERLSAEDSAMEKLVIIDLHADAEKAIPWLKSVPEFTTVILKATANPADPRAKSVSELYGTQLFPWIDSFRAIAQATSRWTSRVALAIEPGAHPYFVGLDAFFKSWLKEDGFDAYKRVEMQKLADSATLAQIVEDEFLDYRHVDVRYDGAKRFVREWKPIEASATSALSGRPVILSLGGGRGIGAAILEKLVVKYPLGRFHIAGRSSAESEKTRTTLKQLRSLGADVTYHQVDVANAEALQALVQQVAKDGGAIDVVLNGAGQELSRSLQSKTDDEIWREFEGKVSPASSLMRVSREIPIRHIVNYSSVAAAFGNTGQTIYALGNQIQVELGERFSASSSTRVTSLVLPPWENLGMTENVLILNGLKASGVAMLPKEVGTELVLKEIEGACGREVAFLDANDVRAYDCELSNRRVHEGLFSRPISTGTALKLPLLNRRDQPYLNDHVINGNVIYPGSSALALMFYVGYHYFRRVPTIENFEVHSFLAPELETSAVELEVIKISETRLKLQISSRRVLHFLCEVVDSEDAPQVKSLGAFIGKGSVECEPLYNNDHIALGKKFQLAKSLWFNDRHDFQQTSSNQELGRYTSNVLFDRLQQWFESALQVLGCQLLWQTKHYWVPNRISRLVARFDRELSDELCYRVAVESQKESLTIAHAYALNAKGETVFQMETIEDIEVGSDEKGGNFQMKKPAAARSNQGVDYV